MRAVAALRASPASLAPVAGPHGAHLIDMHVIATLARSVNHRRHRRPVAILRGASRHSCKPEGSISTSSRLDTSCDNSKPITQPPEFQEHKKNQVIEVLPPLILKLEEVEKLTSLKSTTIFSLISNDQFPKPRRLSSGRSGWVYKEIVSWAENLPISDLLPPANAGKRKNKNQNEENKNPVPRY
jgi:prophage regulatory protein